jgi:DNA-binding transcriptional ArsR family regulator
MEKFRSLVRAMAHPTRCRILTVLCESVDGASVRQLAEQVGEPRRKVRYHLDLLIEQGLVTLAAERKRRGVLEHYYRSEQLPMIPTAYHWLIGRESSEQIAKQVLWHVLADARAAVAAGLFGSGPLGHVEARLTGDVDPQGWEELTAVHDKALDEMQSVLAESRIRLLDADRQPMPFVSAQFLFQKALPRPGERGSSA